MKAILYRDHSYGQYAELPGWNWSVIKQLHKSPLHAAYARKYPSPDTAQRRFLRAIHCAALEPEKLERSFVEYAGRRDKRIEAYREFLAGIEPGAEVLTPKEMCNVNAVAAALRADQWVGAKLAGPGSAEICVTWIDKETGLPCKGRIDLLAGDKRTRRVQVVDLKGYGTTAHGGVGAAAGRALAHGQMAHYKAGLEAHGLEVDAVSIVSYETSGALDVAVFHLDPGAPDGALYEGEKLRRRLMGELAACLESDHWPGRQRHGPENLTLPPWAYEEDRFEFTDEDEEIP